MKYAAIDIGTNAARLLVGEVTKEGEHSFVKKISYTRIPLRLGDEVFMNGMISNKKKIDFIKTIHAFKLISEIFDVNAIRACATSAMREAINSSEIIEEIKSHTGIQIEVITGDEEAKLIFGTFFLLDFDKKNPFIVIDVGGGSTEVSVFENGTKVASRSFQIGTIRLLKNKTDKNIWKTISSWIDKNVELTMEHQIFATGGNINKVHKLLGAQFNDSIKVRDLKKLRNRLNVLSIEERMDLYQLKPDRADVIVPACDIYLSILKKLKVNELFVPKIGLSDGIVYDLFLKQTN
ncbi:MAG: ethanolamine ammonia-lyase reactivating factor EutA [Flavobacteriia bacterium]|nr:ethanolamine ammonia-lyase reactivating factor EutA [Flavobacteriia bacterium]